MIENETKKRINKSAEKVITTRNDNNNNIKSTQGGTKVDPHWGRSHNISYLTAFLSSLLMFTSPLMVIYFWTACNSYGCSLAEPAIELYSLLSSPTPSIVAVQSFLYSLLPVPTLEAAKLYVYWLLFQFVLYVVLPAKTGYGQQTPAGHRLPYKVNGLLAWVVSHVCFLVASCYFELFPASLVQRHWGGLLVAANCYGYSLTLFSYIKAHIAPSHPTDRKFTNSRLYDIFMGIELNPRFGNWFDFKLFHNGRPGIVAWTLINLSFGFAQYERIGYVTNSMVLLNILHAAYVLDFFVNEDWYLRTIDIAHDHFGFYLSWGDTVWLPYMYTLQSHYLYRNPVDLSYPMFSGVLALGTGGYLIFRAVNHQKDVFRSSPNGNCIIWGKKATFVSAKYVTADGTEHIGRLLTSGFWGNVKKCYKRSTTVIISNTYFIYCLFIKTILIIIGLSRHFNYVGDLMLSFAMCLTCGFEHLLPYFYIIYMTMLLVHRIYRDDERCFGKYGDYWIQYKSIVRWKLLPYVFINFNITALKFTSDKSSDDSIADIVKAQRNEGACSTTDIGANRDLGSYEQKIVIGVLPSSLQRLSIPEIYRTTDFRIDVPIPNN
ncbi:Delta14-sterol reductase [Heterostelium album PN500]|uniref:7-dehydrocholesterol reductase n=1 Tax=Heterostelium pallidum (strain ATCC 26659 / Pp 5 / PN500) TaxID=670386 RepID=D3BLI8_HETP5|nr:Delta14-sterol reductase [Heterostelium album PN500]EFA77439.1 Delta14-sterol reductase [Heterostelium album PN500]|eukprot:XP_020429567.1 Delta14-sterol reductase [Heterostelium album PN500]